MSWRIGVLKRSGDDEGSEGAKVEKGMSGRVEAEKKRMRERGARMRKRRRQSRSVRDVRKAMGGIEENQWRKRGCKFLGVGKCGFPFERK